MVDSSIGRTLLVLYQPDSEKCDLRYCHVLGEFESEFQEIFAFNDEKDCLEFIQNCSHHDYIILLFVGTSAEINRSGFIDLIHLHAIYVYDYKSSIYHRSLISPSQKIRSIISTIDALFQKLHDDMTLEKAERETTRKILELIKAYYDWQATMRRHVSQTDGNSLETSETQANDSTNLIQCPLSSMGCLQLIVQGKEAEHYTSEEHISFLHAAIDFLINDYESVVKTAQDNYKIQDFDSVSSVATNTKMKTYSQGIEHLTRLTVDAYSSLNISLDTSHNNDATFSFSSAIVCRHKVLQTSTDVNMQEDGVLVWAIANISERIIQFRSNTKRWIESPVFRACTNGPNVVARLHINEKIPGLPFLALYIHLVPPQQQSFLGDFKFTLVDVSGKPPLYPLVKYFDASKIPMTDYIGIEDFIPKHHLLDLEQYVREDLSFLIVQTRPSHELEFTPIPKQVRETLNHLLNSM